MEPFLILIGIFLLILIIDFLVFKRKQFFIISSLILYIILIGLIVLRYYNDYQSSIEMFVILGKGSATDIPDIVKSLHITNIFFIIYSIVYVIFLVIKIKLTKEQNK